MIKQPASILIADDDSNVLTALKLLLKSESFHVTTVEQPHDVLQLIERKSFSCVIIDLNYHRDTTSGQEGFELLAEIKKRDELLPVIVMTGFSSIEIAVEAMKLGAVDFIQKPWRNNDLIRKVETQITLGELAQRGNRLAQENALLKSAEQLNQQQIVADSPTMKSVISQIEKLAFSDMNILFTGENGTGKSMLASYLHQCSTRSEHTFLSVNMGAITETLFESEMFGHVKGAFTDSKETRIGRFELADNGTIFLDEIANIPLSQQAKLLRVLEERQFEKVGSAKTQHVNVRLVSATNANLQAMVNTHDFRQDLLYRLNTVEIHIPSLRDRKQDIIPLANYFIGTFCEKYRLENKTFSESAKTALTGYLWPGNIRELSHIVERALFLSQDDAIHVADLGLPDDNITGFDFEKATLDEIEAYVITQRLTSFDQKVQETIDSLGISRSAYYRRIEKYRL
ncbi:MAG: sigma-54-dependent Fis family transcriptional regulator [Colwelliaceae bacterium]|jgi:DNA-binding NtrC family response regulator|nr:sigma-54-dependent Fis family transcriptional regulator [Colwelliaceae bacterium]